MPKRTADRIVQLHKFLHLQILKEMCLPFDPRKIPLESGERGISATIDAWEEIHIPDDLRVDSREDLRLLFTGFQFPAKVVSKNRTTFTGEEVFLFGIYRLVHPGKYAQRDIREHFGFNNPSLCSQCFHLFLKHMTYNRGYLLTNNVEYWTPYLEASAEAIRAKCLEKGCYFTPGTFCIFAFIDNTMNGTCRPGGGPTRDGENAPRNDPLIQQAWYNGWKKLHGMKWQSIDLPNGMNYHVWGAVSVRHNDMFTLRHSNINEIIAAAQRGREFQFCVYGDSAYAALGKSHLRARHNFENNTVRETLENTLHLSRSDRMGLRRHR